MFIFYQKSFGNTIYFGEHHPNGFFELIFELNTPIFCQDECGKIIDNVSRKIAFFPTKRSPQWRLKLTSVASKN